MYNVLSSYATPMVVFANMYNEGIWLVRLPFGELEVLGELGPSSPFPLVIITLLGWLSLGWFGTSLSLVNHHN